MSTLKAQMMRDIMNMNKMYVKTRAARYIACDSHAHLVSKDGSVISAKSPSPVFKWSGI